MLHAKYQVSWRSVCQRLCFVVSIAYVKYVTLRMGSLLAQGYNLNNLSRRLRGYATYQISTFWSQWTLSAVFLYCRFSLFLKDQFFSGYFYMKLVCMLYLYKSDPRAGLT